MASDFSHRNIKATFARISSTIFMDNAKQIADVIFSGVCHRFPRLDFVSVESGVGWLGSALEAMDWQWRNGGVDEGASRNTTCFRVNTSSARSTPASGSRSRRSSGALERFPNNIMWETDYPHPTSMSPGPATPADAPRDYIDRALGGLPDEVVHNVLEATAAKVYQLN